jgi:hypothetical protein
MCFVVWGFCSFSTGTRPIIFSFTSSHPILPHFSSGTLVVFTVPFSCFSFEFSSAASALPAVPFSQYSSCLTLSEFSLAFPSRSTSVGGASLSDSFDLQLMQHRRLQVHRKLCHRLSQHFAYLTGKGQHR